ncbi:YczE/YyaS/YitT family protein [Lapidilactobacillus wuchangensis]|uniref:YczE/YyaS/YitT family protein n=1 Tax=Lapidilactobacillus wuchangensis TaxID=2486001 RepID=UPI000F7845CD|nr:DUF6198 family protein [Lapidilactobacillus wuchangensis]
MKSKDFNRRLGYLIFAIALDAAANALMIHSNLGSAVWTASAVNLAQLLKISNGTTLFVYAILVSITNQFLLKHFDGRIFISNLIFALPFSYLVDLFVYLLQPLNIGQLNFPLRLLCDVTGLIGIAVGISIYQRCNIVQHPNDELAYLLRFKYLHDSAGLGQLISYVPPFLVMLICYLATGHLVAVGIGTILAIFTQGWIIGWADQLIVPSLKHHFRE